jgi:hypothetical protein
MTAMLGAARQAHVRRTVHRHGRRGRCGSGGPAGYNSDGTGGGRRDRRSYKLHSGGFSRGLETSCGGAGGGPEPADIEGARSRSHGLSGWRRSGQSSDSESRSLRTAGVTTCRAAPLACSDWSEERDVGRSRLDRVDGGGDNWKPGRTGRRPSYAVAGVLVCAVGALDITPRDLISHRFTRSLDKGLSSARSSYTIDDCMITSDTPTHPCGKLSLGLNTCAIAPRLFPAASLHAQGLARPGRARSLQSGAQEWPHGSEDSRRPGKTGTGRQASLTQPWRTRRELAKLLPDFCRQLLRPGVTVTWTSRLGPSPPYLLLPGPTRFFQ